MIKKILAQNTVQFRTSLLYYVGNFLLNFFRYLFHLILLRLLTPPEYGEFLSYLSFMYLLAVPTGTIANVVTKFIADYKGKKDTDSINVFFYYLVKKTAPIGLFVGLSFVVFSSPLATIFKAHPLAFIILGVSTFITLFQTITSSYLFGFQKYLIQTILGFVNVVLTVVSAILFINLGFGATGAVLGQIISGIFVTIATLYLVKDSIYPMVKSAKIKTPLLKNFALYSFIYSLGTMSLMSVDILIVRALFNTHTSGLYSSLSILGRMILFGLTPIINLVLPMVSLRHSQKIETKPIFFKLGLSISVLGFLGSFVFLFYPKTIVSLLSGVEYLSVSHLLPIFAFSMVFFAFSQFILSYLMATGREKSNFILLAITIIQPIGLYLFGHSLELVSWINLIIYFVLFLSLSIYALNADKTKIKSIYDQAI